MPRTVSHPQELEEARKGLPLDSLGAQGPGDTVILDFWPPEPCENTCLLFSATGLRSLVAAALGHPTQCSCVVSSGGREPCWWFASMFLLSSFANRLLTFAQCITPDPCSNMSRVKVTCPVPRRAPAPLTQAWACCPVSPPVPGFGAMRQEGSWWGGGGGGGLVSGKKDFLSLRKELPRKKTASSSCSPGILLRGSRPFMASSGGGGWGVPKGGCQRRPGWGSMF